MLKVLFICHGNICRSPMAQSVFQHLVDQKGVKQQFYVDSAATSREEIGNSPHYGTKSILKKNHIPLQVHYARQLTVQDGYEYDYIIGMDQWNIKEIKRILANDCPCKVFRLLDVVDHPRDIADPWYTGDFERTFEDVKEGCKFLLEKLLNL